MALFDGKQNSFSLSLHHKIEVGGYGPDTIFVRKPIDEVPATFSTILLGPSWYSFTRATRHALLQQTHRYIITSI